MGAHLGVSWLSFDDQVAYMARTSEGQNIKIHNLESGEERLLLSEEDHEQYRKVVKNFQWSDDGSKIVFCAHPRHENSRSNSASDAVVATIGTGDEPKIEVVAVEAAHERVVFHPTTNEIFFQNEFHPRARIASIQSTLRLHRSFVTLAIW